MVQIMPRATNPSGGSGRQAYNDLFPRTKCHVWRKRSGCGKAELMAARAALLDRRRLVESSVTSITE